VEQAPGPQINGDLALITPELISQRVQAAGYSLMQQPRHQDSGSVRTVVVVGSQGQSAVTVMFYDFDPSIASSALESITNSLGQQPGAMTNDQRRVLYVRCMNSSSTAQDSQHMLELLLR
jgi:hypothetical protein